ncbi:hypothetical protein TIFTF001_004870 [Ficus carica]|uniref:Uncharacterized protein n=1 Tax=Ficus carica TaxID=3494 RepID=A0AA87ZKN9_FICCA|nr:hypothetical protein TIFTF001_004870 [Ficus carica]
MGNCVGTIPKRNLIDHKPPNLPTEAADQNGDVPTKSEGNNNMTTDTPTIGRPSILKPSLKVFNLAELKLATGEFRRDSFLGEGGFGEVFKGWIDEKTYAPSMDGVGMAVAVKKSKFPYSCQGPREGKVTSRRSSTGLQSLIVGMSLVAGQSSIECNEF